MITALDNEDSDTEAYFYDLVSDAPAVSEVLESLKTCSFYRSLQITPTSISPLSTTEIELLLDPGSVAWNDFHTGIITSIANHKASAESEIGTKSKGHNSIVFDSVDSFNKKYPDCIVNSSQRKKEAWSSAVDVLAFEFRRIMELRLFRGASNLKSNIEEILESGWKPCDKEHEECLYYIVGAMLQVVKKMGNRCREDFAHVLAELFENATATRESASAADMPIGRVLRREEFQLTYPNPSFFKFMMRIESVFDSLLQEEQIQKRGVSIVSDITSVLARLDTGFAAFVPSASEEELKEVSGRFYCSYGNLRGKDATRRFNAQAGFRYGETLRSKLGTLSEASSMRKAKKKSGGDTDGNTDGDTNNSKGKGSKRKGSSTSSGKAKKGRGKKKNDATAAKASNAATMTENEYDKLLDQLAEDECNTFLEEYEF